MAERVQGGSRVEDLRYTRYEGERRGRLACLRRSPARARCTRSVPAAAGAAR